MKNPFFNPTPPDQTSEDTSDIFAELVKESKEMVKSPIIKDVKSFHIPIKNAKSQMLPNQPLSSQRIPT